VKTGTIAALALLLTLSHAPMHAQEQGGRGQSEHPPTRVPVTVALQDTTNQSASYRILRRADAAPLDVIVLTGKSDAVTLSDAISDLLLVRRVQGDTAKGDGAVRLRRSRPNANSARVPRYPWTQRVVNDLRHAEVQDVRGVGRVRAVQIWLPPQNRRSAPPGQAGAPAPSGY
jgi:hypothetical protein